MSDRIQQPGTMKPHHLARDPISLTQLRSEAVDPSGPYISGRALLALVDVAEAAFETHREIERIESRLAVTLASFTNLHSHDALRAADAHDGA